MELVSFIKKVLFQFNNSNVKYLIIRNYEFIIDPKESPGNDLDIVVDSTDFKKAKNILINLGFIEAKQQFSLKHRGFRKYLSSIKKTIGFDIQVGGIHWNDIPYLDAKTVISRKVKKGIIYTLSSEDAYVMYLCHSVLGKRFFKEKYAQKLIELSGQNLNFQYIQKKLQRIFSHSISNGFINKIKEGRFNVIKRNSYYYAIYYVFKNPRNIFPFFLLFLRWFFTPKYCPLRKIPLIKHLIPAYPMISIIGPDGSGKTTNAFRLKKTLVLNSRHAKIVYTGRGKSNIIPIKKLGAIYKRVERKRMKKNGLLKKIIYTMAAPVYTFDLIIRYLLKIYPLLKSEKVVITDRYASDILLMPHVPLWLKKILLSIFPKPTLTFYLHNDATILYERRRQQSVDELNRQMELFKVLAEKFDAISIITKRPKRDGDRIASIVFKKLAELGY